MGTAESSSTESRFALRRWSGQFADAETEATFRDDRFERDALGRRIRIAGSAALFGGFCVGVWLLFPEQRLVALLATLPAWASFLGCVAVLCAGRRFRTLYLVCLAMLNSTSGLSAVIIGNWIVPIPNVALAGAIVGMFFQFANTTQPARWIGASVLPYAVVELAALLLSGDRLEAPLGVLVFVGGYALAAAASVGANRGNRRSYAQERIIAEQRATIAKQQELLKRELSHQVAERSRELGAVLAKSAVTLDARRLNAGERFAERYKIMAALGAGGMGAVYEVERVTDGETLALKAVTGEVSGASAARFAREAEIGARVRHPNLVSIVDVGVSSGVPFLAMELVRGGSLEAQRSKFGDVEWALPILRQIAEGLAALHDAGVVHRDLKPANVLLAETGAKISDFGISRFGAIEDAPSIDPGAATMAATPKKSADLTGTGVVMGTPLYMAPEGARSARALDASADVFAFGIIAYEMLTGRAPFAVPAFVLAMAEQPIPIPPAIDDARVPSALRPALASALAGDPAQRPRVRALLAALG